MNIYKIIGMFFLTICLNAYGQNLVCNPSFENHTITLPCSWNIGSIDNSLAASDWMIPTEGTSDIFSTLVPQSCWASCFSTNPSAIGRQSPRTGNVMASIIPYGYRCYHQQEYREYLEGQFSSPLITGDTYYAEMYVSMADYAKYASNNIGIYFSDILIDSSIHTELHLIPQIKENSVITDSINWVKISGLFVAPSPAKYFIIGNFKNNGNTASVLLNGNTDYAYYYVDDVLVKPLCFNVSPGRTICQGDTAVLFENGGNLYGWASIDSPGTIISTDSTIAVSPSHSTSYLVYCECDTVMIDVNVIPLPMVDFGHDTAIYQGDELLLNASNNNADYLWQDGSTNPTFVVSNEGTYWVNVTQNGCSASDTINVKTRLIFIPNIFSPNADGQNDLLYVRGKYIKDIDFVIYNRWGNKVFETKNTENGWDGRMNNKDCAEGVYFYAVHVTFEDGETGVRKGNVTLVR
jgi:gliding motility-associated-like protein